MVHFFSKTNLDAPCLRTVLHIHIYTTDIYNVCTCITQFILIEIIHVLDKSMHGIKHFPK